MTTAPRTHIEIRAFTPNMYVDGTYAILNPQVGTTRGGKPFLKGIIRDATGECHMRQWTVDERTIGEVGATGFVWIAGHTQEYNGQVQIIVEQIRSVEVSEEELRCLLPCTKFDVGEMFAELTAILNSIAHPAVKALMQAYLEDEKLMARFREAPAASSLHHAWIGGLLEHTLQLLKLADRMLPLYPALNRDIVLAGLFLHDLAKTAELSWDKGFNYTTTGNLIGHVTMGAIWLERKIREVAAKGGPVLPAKAHLVLSHIILSHHNEPEYGAARRPSTPEAIFVAMLDNLDAKTAMALCHRKSGDDEQPASAAGLDGQFTDRVHALETRLFTPDPLAE
jgi:3'-5' exoribonuclease